MKIAFIARSTLYTAPGGDTIQICETAACLREMDFEVDIFLTNQHIEYHHYDLFHFTNIFRPSDILFHIKRAKKPYVITPILVEYQEYDKTVRRGLSGILFQSMSPQRTEYIKTVARWITNRDVLQTKRYLWKGQSGSIRQILRSASLLLPNSRGEYEKLKKDYGATNDYTIVPNGINASVFNQNVQSERNENLVICAARIEGIKNQLNLIRAINKTNYQLLLIGSSSPNQQNYYSLCKKTAASNVEFLDHLPQQQLAALYRKAKVHALPSWFETCGLSSLEAAAMGCNIVVSEKGYTREYFEDYAFYCDPGEPQSILEAIDKAATSPAETKLQEEIFRKYTWQHAAALTAKAYQKIIPA